MRWSIKEDCWREIRTKSWAPSQATGILIRVRWPAAPVWPHWCCYKYVEHIPPSNSPLLDSSTCAANIGRSVSRWVGYAGLGLLCVWWCACRYSLCAVAAGRARERERKREPPRRLMVWRCGCCIVVLAVNWGASGEIRAAKRWFWSVGPRC